MTTGTNWRNDAACLGADPDLFFPIGTAGPALDQIDEAKRLCRACPVRERCLAWALEAVPSTTRLAMPCRIAAMRNRL